MEYITLDDDEYDQGMVAAASDGDCVLIAHYTREEIEQQRRYEHQQEVEYHQSQNARLMAAYSTLEDQYESVSNELAEEREQREDALNDLRRFGRGQYEERLVHETARAALVQQRELNDQLLVANNQQIVNLQQQVAGLQQAVAQNENMVCVVCLELYVQLALMSE